MGKKKSKTEQTKSPQRPPIVAVLGHVDHGKTTLLDYIRKTHVAEHEHGGITQTIGAYQAAVTTKERKRLITFIDTPGHEAFIKMRSRGAQVSDLAILVVAADDGVMPQTIEAISHIKAANIPLVVAINKMDLPEVDLKRVKRQLAKHGVLVEGYGGDVVAVPISAKTGKGIEHLLEMTILVSDLAEIKGDEKSPLSAAIIESRLDRQRGPIATLIVKNGCLRVGERVRAENIEGKVRSLVDEFGKLVKKATPGKPVEMSGWESVPPVGARVKISMGVNIPPKKTKKTATIQKEGKLKVVLKAKSQGALEALQTILPNDVVIISQGVGDISESDILFAKTTESIVIGYGIKILPTASKLTDRERVVVKTETIIYKLADEINEVAQALREGILEEVLGKAEILAEFQIRKRRIAGVKVTKGRLARGDTVKLLHNDEEVSRSQIVSIRVGKQDISRAEAPKECGIGFSPKFPLDFTVGDTIISYRK